MGASDRHLGAVVELDMNVQARLRASLLVMDVPEATISAAVGYARTYGSVDRITLDADVRCVVERILAEG